MNAKKHFSQSLFFLRHSQCQHSRMETRADGSLLYQAMTSNMLPSKDHTGYFTDKANIRLLNMLKAWIDGGAKN